MDQLNLKTIIYEHAQHLGLIQDIINGFPGIILIRNLNLKFIGKNDLNSIFAQKYYLPTNIIGKTTYDLFPKHISKYITNNLLNVLDSDKEIVKNKTYSTTGKKYYELYKAKPIKVQNKIIGIMSYTVNINYLKQTTIKLFNTNKDLSKQAINIQKIYHNLQIYQEPFKELLGFTNKIQANIINDKNKDLIINLKEHLETLLNNFNVILKSI